MSSATTSPWLATLPHQATDRGHTPDRAADWIPSRAGYESVEDQIADAQGRPNVTSAPTCHSGCTHNARLVTD
jgi:hypothetical protein